MIVGVDESGDFSDGSRVYLVAVLVRPSMLDVVTSALKSWETTTRSRLGLANEIKGANLEDVALAEFCGTVMTAGGDDGVVFMAFAVDVDDKSYAAMRIQRDVFAKGYEAWAEMHVGSSDPKRQRFEKQLRHWGTWMRARSDRQMLKLATLAAILPELLEHSFGFSIARGFDVELVDLRFCLDEGYVKKSEHAFWLDILRNVFIGGTTERPIPFSDQWAPDHPVLEAFVDEQAGSGTVLKSDFKTRIVFHDSATTPVVRLADVIASIVRRSDAAPAGTVVPLGLLRSRCLGNYPFTLLQWSDQPSPPMPNPYLSISDEAVQLARGVP